MNNKIFRYLQIATVMSIALASCQIRDIVPVVMPEQDDIVLNFEVSTPDMQAAPTRAVSDNGVESLVLFCFGADGKFIDVVFATEHTPGVAGSFSAVVRGATKIVHLLGNQDISAFDKAGAAGRSEAELMSTLPGSRDKVIYWGRVAASGTHGIAQAFSGTDPVKLVRNMARIEVKSTVKDFSITGITLFSVSSEGTVAPYNHTAGQFDWITSSSRDYLTLPETVTLIDQPSSALSASQFSYETRVNLAAPAGVILKASDGKFYKLLVQDSEGKDLPLIRNHRYTFTLGSKPNYPYSTFEEARSGVASNNVWATVSDEVTSIESQNETLSVEKAYIFIKGTDAAHNEDIRYSYTVDGSAGTPPAILWAGDNNVAEPDFVHSYAADGKGTITLTVKPMESMNLRQGTLAIRTESGLQRRIKVYSVRETDFASVSVTPVGNPSGTPSRQTVRLSFTIPSTIPEEYCPFKVLITAKGLDAASSNRLDVITKDTAPDEYGEDQAAGWSYKYSCTVEASSIGSVITLDFVTTTSSAYRPAANPIILESPPIFKVYRIE